MKEGDAVTTIEMAVLTDWLRMQGHSDEEIIECIHYIATAKPALNQPKPDSKP